MKCYLYAKTSDFEGCIHVVCVEWMFEMRPFVLN